ncbi:MAG: purine-nucleoside phosphorylase [Ignavibacteria bacterium RBG_13_36_8]|nr:MAG: purine-nucleoside phosphorylase [Ignavibacteria bacterium RBG_13_36_8]
MNAKYEKLVLSIEKIAPFTPQIGLVLGSGLGDFAKNINIIKSIETSSLPGYPKSTVEGHRGFIHFAEYKDKKLLLFQGRIHFYEGYSLSKCVLPAHIIYKLGCKYLILTNAAGGINPEFEPGDLMLITSFNAILLKKELADFIGIPTSEEKNRSYDLPSKQVNEKIRHAALEEKIFLREGVYFFSKGPSYETPAEIKMAARSGADAVGMSTVHEAIYAAIKEIKVGVISCITNHAAGIKSVKLSHQDVIDTAEKVKTKFERLIKRSIQEL